MRIAALLLTFALPGVVFAQETARDALITARLAGWHVRVTTDRDTVEGGVRSVFRDSARVSNRRVFVPAVTRIERRVRAGDPFGWQQVWPQPTSAVSRDTTAANGITAYVYAGTGMLVVPELFLPLPPPVLAGMQIGSRNRRSEYTVNGRVLIYPEAFAIFAIDGGVNFFSDPRAYAGIAVGIVTGPEGPLLMMGAARAGIRGHGLRLESRIDVVTRYGIGAVATFTLGFDNTQHRRAK